MLFWQQQKRRRKGNPKGANRGDPESPSQGPTAQDLPLPSVRETRHPGRMRVRPRRAGLPGWGGFLPGPHCSPSPPGRDPAASDSTRGQLRIRGAHLSPARGLRDDNEKEEESHSALHIFGVRPRAAESVPTSAALRPEPRVTSATADPQRSWGVGREAQTETRRRHHAQEAEPGRGRRG